MRQTIHGKQMRARDAGSGNGDGVQQLGKVHEQRYAAGAEITRHGGHVGRAAEQLCRADYVEDNGESRLCANQESC